MSNEQERVGFDVLSVEERNWIDRYIARKRATSKEPLTWSEIKQDYEDNYGNDEESIDRVVIDSPF